jgi:hypothetical protein
MSAVEILARATRPENCVVGFGIPTTVKGFRESRRQGLPNSFVRNKDPNAYQRLVIDPCQRLGAHMQRLGARVIPDLTLDRYATLFQGPDTHAVILISHWGGDFIEFRDGPAGVEAFIAAVPESFRGVIDLCTCPAPELLSPLRASRMDCVITHITKDAALIFWLYFYRDLLRILRRGARNYLDTVVELTAAYFGAPQEVRT